MLRGILRRENPTYVLVAAATSGFTVVSFIEALSRRNTFVAPPSALVVQYATFMWLR